MIKKIKITMLILLILIIISFIVIYLKKNEIVGNIYTSDLKTQINEMKFLTFEQKNDANIEFDNSNNKVEVVNKYQNLNKKYENFDQNEQYLINPSAVKSISDYKPNLIDLKKENSSLLTEDAIKNDEGQISKIMYSDFLNLVKDAEKHNINLQVNSAYRSYEKQKDVKQNLDNVAANPGESEHQSGLAIDFAQPNYQVFKDAPAYKYLLENGYKFGFILSFPNNSQKLTGETFEQWHWRYVGIQYAKLFFETKQLKEKILNETYTYTNFVEDYFDFSKTTNKQYDNLNELIKFENINNYVVVKNKKIVNKSDNIKIKSNYETIHQILKTKVVENYLKQNKTEFTSIFENSIDKINLEEINLLINKVGGLEIVNTQITNKLINKLDLNLEKETNLSELNFPSQIIKENNSYDIDNETYTSTIENKDSILSVIYFGNNSYVAINRKINSFNAQEMLKQRNIVKQFVKLIYK